MNLLIYTPQLHIYTLTPTYYIRTYTHTYIHTYIHTHIHTYIHTYTSQVILPYPMTRNSQGFWDTELKTTIKRRYNITPSHNIQQKEDRNR